MNLSLQHSEQFSFLKVLCKDFAHPKEVSEMNANQRTKVMDVPVQATYATVLQSMAYP